MRRLKIFMTLVIVSSSLSLSSGCDPISSIVKTIAEEEQSKRETKAEIKMNKDNNATKLRLEELKLKQAQQKNKKQDKKSEVTGATNKEENTSVPTAGDDSVKDRGNGKELEKLN
jgi:hypothetical protein